MLVWLSLLVSCSDKRNDDSRTEPQAIVVKPVCPVLSTCQRRSRTPGDDGGWQAGKWLPTEERFLDHGDGTFTDRLTGRMWMFALPTPGQIGYGESVRSKDGTGITGNLFLKEEQVARFLEAMNAGRFGSYGKGFTDWRWPTIVELTSLMQFTGF